MSDLLRRQIDNAMQDVVLRERATIRIQEPRKRTEHEKETRQMRWDVIKAMQWLENCRK